MKLKEFFYFSKSDRSALLVLLSIGILAFLIIYGIGSQNTETGASSGDSLSFQWQSVSSRGFSKKKEKSYYYADQEQKVERFSFDPNSADSTQFLRLGLQPWQVRAIYHYRAKGGIFRKKTDFARLYGLTVKQYRELEPYIKISSDYLPATEVYAEKGKASSVQRDTMRYPVKLRPAERVFLNAADTSQLKKVPGIGSYFARQVVNYRARLGGFYALEQLAEIDDFPMESVRYMVLDVENVRRMNLNKLTLNQLKRHPYINFYQARAICDYRRLKGPLHSLDDLRLLKDFSQESIERLRPYVEF